MGFQESFKALSDPTRLEIINLLKKGKLSAVSWILVLTGFLVGLIFYPNLPKQLPMHFNIAGEIDGYGSTLTIFLLPGLILVLILFAEISSRHRHREKQ